MAWSKLISTAAAALITLSLAAAANATHLSQDREESRLEPIGQVYMEGDEVPTVSNNPVVAADTASDEPRSGEAVFTAACKTCHASDSAIPNAPKFGNQSDWEPRIAKGEDVLLSSVKNGLGAMPPMGMCMDCSDDELEAAIEHMVSSVQ